MMTSPLPPALICTIHTSDSEKTKRPLYLAHQTVPKNHVQLLTSAFEQAVSLKNTPITLENECATLTHKINTQKHTIKLLEIVHQEKWTIHINEVKVKMHAIGSEISTIIQSITFLQDTYPELVETADKAPQHDKMLRSLGSDLFGQIMGALACDSISLPFFKDWLLSVRGPPVHKHYEKHPQCEIRRATLQNIKELRSQVHSQAVFSPILIAAQKRFALEKEITFKREELAALTDLYASRKKEHEIFMKQWSFFEPCLEHAHLLEHIMDAHIAETNALILENEKEPLTQCLKRGSGTLMYKMRKGLIEEAVRLKGMIGAVIPNIEKAVEWANKEI